MGEKMRGGDGLCCNFQERESRVLADFSAQSWLSSAEMTRRSERIIRDNVDGLRRDDPHSQGTTVIAESVMTTSTSRKRQRSSSRDCARATGLWGNGSLGGGPGSTNDDLDFEPSSSVAVVQPSPQVVGSSPVHDSSDASRDEHSVSTENVVQVESQVISARSAARDSRLLIQLQVEGESDSDRSHRIAFLSSRGYLDGDLLEAMHASVYDDEDEDQSHHFESGMKLCRTDAAGEDVGDEEWWEAFRKEEYVPVLVVDCP